MPRLDPGQVVLEHRRQDGGNSGAPVLVALSRPDGQWRHLHIEGLAPEPEGCHAAQAAPVEELGDHRGGAVHARENGGNFFAGHDHRNVECLVGAHGIDTARQSIGEDARVEEHQGRHRLVLGRGSHVSMHGKVCQERFDRRFGGEEVLARPHAMETDEPDDPLYRGALDVHGAVVQTEHLSHVIEEVGLLTCRRVRPIRSPSWCPKITDNGHRAKLPENPTNIVLSGQNGQLINGWTHLVHG
jgi:hypothetical protein